MARLKGKDLVDRFTDTLGLAKGTTGDGSAARVLAVNAINAALGKIGQLGSLRFLQVWSTVQLNLAFDVAALPSVAPLVDTSKRATIAQPGGRKGTLTFLPDHLFNVTNIDEYGAWNTDRPSAWTWGADSTGVARIQFDRVNTSFGALLYPFRFQQIPPAIVDDNVTVSILPDGNYDESILLPLAECETKRTLGYAGWEDLWKQLYGDDESNDNGRLAKLLDQWRVAGDNEPDSEAVRIAQLATASEGK